MLSISNTPQPPEMEGSHCEELVSQDLCDKCQNAIDEMDKKDGLEIPFYGNSSLMKHSAEKGCLLCGQILAIIETEQIKEPFDINVIQRRIIQSNDSGSESDSDSKLVRGYRLTFQNGVGDKYSEYPYPAIFLGRQCGRRVFGFLKAESYRVEGLKEIGDKIGPVDIKRSRKDALPLIKQWLHTCSSEHNCANNVPGKPFLPTRLVYTKGSTPRLCLAVDIVGSIKYATLSHCWGTLETVTLSQSNIDAFKKEIPSTALTQTFKDAIEAAQALGIDYIWIDSLCIIQDKDSDDWAVESAKMSNVYGNSYLNIAATSAPDGRYGLFQVGKEHRNTSFRAWTSGKSKNRVSYHCVPYYMYENSMLNAPLMQRAWVVQERLLSSRTVHFTSTQVFWECDRKMLCEAYPIRMDEYLITREIGRLLKKPLLEYRWESIVELYSRCSLTFSPDKLPAISGVADAMKISRKCEYIAGLWADDSFHLQLCWSVLQADRLPKPKYRAPSWSWAAVDSPVVHELEDPDDVMSVDSDDLSDDSDDVMSDVSDDVISEASIRMPPCVEICCFGTAAKSSEYLEEASVLPLVLKCKYLWPIKQAAIDGFKMRWFSEWSSFDYLNQNMEDLYLLFIVGNPYRTYGEIGCLIVEKTLIKQGQYRRVGYVQYDGFSTQELEGYKEFRDKLRKGKLEEQDLLPPDSYIKDLRNEKSQFVYQIELI